ncbi:MAG: glycosyltransferase 87 family protein, partial [Acidobacteriota bacterium]|nr:glycosyltransferase 87 family protein [Acidobacteriota bacterium]
MRWDAGPWAPQRSNHSFVSSYWVAGEHIHTAPDVYAEEIYSEPQADPKAIRVGRRLGLLIVDQFEYPPPFLVVPRLIAAATGDFWNFRRVWFALNLAVVVAGLIIVAARFDRALGTGARWLTPFALVAPAMMVTLIMGNVQLAIIAASMIAMVLFDRGRSAAGGA